MCFSFFFLFKFVITKRAIHFVRKKAVLGKEELSHSSGDLFKSPDE
jgi:hypothetical protein